jgi:hypothetical protein
MKHSVLLSCLALAVLASSGIVARAQGVPGMPVVYPSPASVYVRAGFGGSVTSVQSQGGAAAETIAGFSCPKALATVVATAVDANGNPFCITASTQGLSVVFAASLPFATSKSLDCAELYGNAASPATTMLSIEARIGHGWPAWRVVFDGARAMCDISPGFAYALSVETQGVGAEPQNPGVIPAGKKMTRSLLIPWSLLHLSHHATAMLINLDICGNLTHCDSSLAQFVVPLTVLEGSGSLSVANDPYVRLSTPAPKPGATPFRVHDVEVDGAFNWDVHDIVSTTFSQDESYVADQRALAQALSLAPLSLPVAAPTISVTQTLQVQSQSLFGFQMPSTYLEDPSLKPLFDVLPFSVTRVGSLSSGYAYGYTSDDVNAGLFYGLQARGWYAGSSTVTFALPTPKPTPNPSPTPAPVGISQTAAGGFSPLKPPPPPAPFLESQTASVPPLQVSLLNGFTGSKGGRDEIDALSFEAHAYGNQTATADSYSAETVNFYGRVERNFAYPSPALDSSLSQFFGESSTFTTASTSSHASYFQVRETAGEQQDDVNFSPATGTTTWLSPLSGPVGHVTMSYASGSQARFVSLDLIGFRLSNEYGDMATEEGWQVSVPLPNVFDTPGWLLTAGSETQTVSDRMAVLEQGDVPNYAAALTEVLPTPGPHGVYPATVIRPERLGNALVLSPWLGNDALQASFSGGYDFGTVTGCGTTTVSHKTVYQCLTDVDDRGVGGIFLRNGPNGKFGIGATDTSTMQGNVTAGSAARSLGTTGALPGTTTSYITYSGCPRVSAAYTNAAFPSGVPLPQQGQTISGIIDYPWVIGAQQIDFTLGYFNERTSTNGTLDQSGVFGMIKISTPFHMEDSACGR